MELGQEPVYTNRRNKVIKNFNPDSPDPRQFARVNTIGKIVDMRAKALVSGLRVGDIFWRYGDWSFLNSWRGSSLPGRAETSNTMGFYSFLTQEIKKRYPSSTKAAVLRDGRLQSLTIPPLPERRLGIDIETRTIPLDDLRSWGLIP
jgi:hypothetical protein